MTSRKLVRGPTPKPRPKMTKEGKWMINGQMWIMYPQTHILPKVSLSCSFLKTMKLSSEWLSKDEVQRLDTCQGPTELLLICCSIESIWNPTKIQIEYIYIENQLADILTKESFSRDKWNHLLCLSNIMSLSMFSCSHFSDFSITSRLESRASCQKEVKRRFQMKTLRWQSRDQ